LGNHDNNLTPGGVDQGQDPPALSQRTQRQLEISEVRYRRLFEAARDGILILDATTARIMDVNPFMLELLKYPREHFIGKELWEIGVFPDKEQSKAAMRQLQKEHSIRFEDMPLKDKSGNEHPVEFVSNVYQEADQLVIQCNIRDISERKRFADERETHLTNEQLLRMEAETSNRAKDKFLAVLSHELRTPLAPVVMTIQAIELDPELPTKFREDLGMVRRNINLEVMLINDLLDLSRVANGKLRLQMEVVSVHEVLAHAIRNSISETSGKRLHVRQDFHASTDWVSGDSARLQQVFWNLLRNAAKFTPEGGSIAIRTRNLDDDARLLVEIQDSGVGIATEDLPRIFNAFEQGSSRTTLLFGGLGLGLAIAKAVVEMHGGTIIAASEGRDQGSTFSVQLQTVRDRIGNKVPNPPTKQPTALRPSPASRILLVEDHPDTARTLSRLLTASGYDVKTAHSVSSALQLAAAETFDVLVSDIGLPDATGYELMEQIRDLYGMRGIAVSGYGMDDDMRKSRQVGFADHLVKPIDLSQLEAVIRRVLSRDRIAGESIDGA
jgi:PAS domain S-box-containing protein